MCCSSTSPTAKKGIQWEVREMSPSWDRARWLRSNIWSRVGRIERRIEQTKFILVVSGQRKARLGSPDHFSCFIKCEVRRNSSE